MELSPDRWRQEENADQRAAEANLLMDYVAAPSTSRVDRQLLLHLAWRLLLEAPVCTAATFLTLRRLDQMTAQNVREINQELLAEAGQHLTTAVNYLAAFN